MDFPSRRPIVNVELCLLSENYLLIRIVAEGEAARKLQTAEFLTPKPAPVNQPNYQIKDLTGEILFTVCDITNFYGFERSVVKFFLLMTFNADIIWKNSRFF